MSGLFSYGGAMLKLGGRLIDPSMPLIMGVLNVTPDSFFDGGALYDGGRLSRDLILAKVAQLVEEGADVIDVGGESTRPGASPVEPDEEMARVLPVVEAIVSRFDVAVSVDTSNPRVMVEAAGNGAGLINDVRALERPGALTAAASTGLPVCLMHMRGTPQTMQSDPQYDDAVAAVRDYLRSRILHCTREGIPADRIIVDPGIGFGKTDEHNLALLRSLQRFAELAPVLVGVSRKSLFGRLLGRSSDERLSASVTTGLLACQRGASILRVHDVAATRDALTMWRLLR